MMRLRHPGPREVSESRLRLGAGFERASFADGEFSDMPTKRRLHGFPILVPMSDQLHFVERIRMVDRNEMQIQFTTEDPVALAKAIEATITYERVTDFNRMIDEDDTDCRPGTDRNPVDNGRFTTVVH
jgi:hypothetical protein